MAKPVAKVRTCAECKRVFVNVDSFMKHKYKFGGCRTDAGLLNGNFKLTTKGWKYFPQVGQDGVRYP